MNFVFQCKCLSACGAIALAVVSTGCGGVSAGGGASPSTFFLPGVAGLDIRADQSVVPSTLLAEESAPTNTVETVTVSFQEATYIQIADLDSL